MSRATRSGCFLCPSRHPERAARQAAGRAMEAGSGVRPDRRRGARTARGSLRPGLRKFDAAQLCAVRQRIGPDTGRPVRTGDGRGCARGDRYRNSAGSAGKHGGQRALRPDSGLGRCVWRWTGRRHHAVRLGVVFVPGPAHFTLRLLLQLVFLLALFRKFLLAFFVTVIGSCQFVLSSSCFHFTSSRTRDQSGSMARMAWTMSACRSATASSPTENRTTVPRARCAGQEPRIAVRSYGTTRLMGPPQL